ncbi:hypothetical protein ASE36_13470 [Rhizobium sp. Root274]|nr:hypothetical protein ASC71_13495 [Rhizobium sp. Root1240]KRD29625.1 hypothetical protein ASE36_13470 [Rhizobium sp. Root274]
MALHFHRIMQDAPHTDPLRQDMSIQYEVSRPANNSGWMASPVAAMPQMVTVNTVPKFRPCNDAMSPVRNGEF